MATDRSIARTSRAAAGGPLGMSNSINNAAAQDCLKVTRLVVADTSANVTGAYKIDVFDQFPVTVVAARLWSEAAVASNSSNYATFTLQSDADAGFTSTTAVSTATGFNTSATALIANSSVSIPMSATAANLAIAQGGSLYLQEAKAGTGVSMGGVYGVEVTYRVDGP